MCAMRARTRVYFSQPVDDCLTHFLPIFSFVLTFAISVNRRLVTRHGNEVHARRDLLFEII